MRPVRSTPHSPVVSGHGTLDASFFVDALEEAIEQHGAPEIFNSDQGSQFTSEDFTGVLKHHGIRISMDGKGRYFNFYNTERRHQTLDRRTPDSVYDESAARLAA